MAPAPLTPYRPRKPFHFNPLPSPNTPTFNNSINTVGDESWTADQDMEDAREAGEFSIVPRHGEELEQEGQFEEDGDILPVETEGFALALDDYFKAKSNGDDGQTPDQLIRDFIRATEDEFRRWDQYCAEYAEETGHDPRYEDEGVQFENEEEMERFDNMRKHFFHLEMHLRTWQLFGYVQTLHLPWRKGQGDSESTVLLPAGEVSDTLRTNRDLFNYLMERDPRVKHLANVMEWLVDGVDIPPVEAQARESGWIYTKARIKSSKRLDPKSTKSKNFLASTSRWGALEGGVQAVEVVSELDPDAPLRQKKRLEPEDVESDERVMENLWYFMRAKALPQAMQYCKNAGESWRAHTLVGAAETFPFDVSEENADRFDLPNAERRELWRRTCYNLARSPDASIFEKAIYGLLSGDLLTVIPVCHIWEDHLFAHINSLIESYFSHFLRENGKLPPRIGSFEIYDFLQQHGGDSDHLARIIDALQNVESLQPDFIYPQRTVQGSLISGRLFELVEELARQIVILNDDPNAEVECKLGVDCGDFAIIRDIAHILIANKFLTGDFGINDDQNMKAEQVVGAYISYLGEARKFELTPLYASLVSPVQQVETLGRVFVHVHDEESRKQLIALLEKYKIGVADVLKEIMTKTLDSTRLLYMKVPVPDKTTILGLKTTGINDARSIHPEDDELIRAIDWMLLSEGMEEDIAEAGCHICNRFFATGRLASARKLFEAVPSSAVYSDKAPSSELDGIYKGLYIQYETFINALIALEDWKQLVHRYPPSSKQRPPRADLEAEFTRVQQTVAPVVHSWLDMFPPSSPQHIHEAISIARRLYIPDLTLALHTVYLDAGRLLHRQHYTKVLDLAVTIADSRNDSTLRAWRAAGRLGEYVQAVAEASKAVLGASEGVKAARGRNTVEKAWEVQLGIWNV